MRISDWSSDVCSSDLAERRAAAISATAVAGCVLETASRRGTGRPASRAVAARRSRTAFRACAYMRLRPGRAGFLARIRGYTAAQRSEEHTSELQSLMRTSYAVFCLQKKNNTIHTESCAPRH